MAFALLGCINFGGVIVGHSLRAARDSARPFIDGQPVRDWATEQGRLMTEVSTDPELLNVELLMSARSAAAMADCRSLYLTVAG